MLATRSNYGDIKKYYQGTFVKFKELGDIVLLVDRVTPDAIYANQENGEKVELRLCDEGYELDYVIPKKTVYQDGPYAHALERIPARMWRKGWSQENSQISLINADGTYQRINLNFTSALRFVNKPEYRKLDVFKDGMFQSIALSPRFYATIDGQIGSDQQTIGLFDLNKGRILFYRPFEREMKRLFSDQPYKLVTV